MTKQVSEEGHEQLARELASHLQVLYGYAVGLNDLIPAIWTFLDNFDKSRATLPSAGDGKDSERLDWLDSEIGLHLHTHEPNGDFLHELCRNGFRVSEHPDLRAAIDIAMGREPSPPPPQPAADGDKKFNICAAADWFPVIEKHHFDLKHLATVVTCHCRAALASSQARIEELMSESTVQHAGGCDSIDGAKCSCYVNKLRARIEELERELEGMTIGRDAYELDLIRVISAVKNAIGTLNEKGEITADNVVEAIELMTSKLCDVGVQVRTALAREADLTAARELDLEAMRTALDYLVMPVDTEARIAKEKIQERLAVRIKPASALTATSKEQFFVGQVLSCQHGPPDNIFHFRVETLGTDGKPSQMKLVALAVTATKEEE